MAHIPDDAPLLDPAHHIAGTSSDAEKARAYGYRETNCVILFSPREQGYACPQHPHAELSWSEYNQHVWCPECDEDYLSTTCLIPTVSRPFRGADDADVPADIKKLRQQGRLIAPTV